MYFLYFAIFYYLSGKFTFIFLKGEKKKYGKYLDLTFILIAVTLLTFNVVKIS